MTTTDPYEGVWQSRADAFLSALQPVLGWSEQNGVRCTASALASLVTLNGLGRIIDRHQLPDLVCGNLGEVLPPPAPELTNPLRQYLYETAGFDPDRPCSDQLPAVAEQHGYVLFAARARLLALAA